MLLSRMVLIFGVLIALTPCGICSAAQAGSSHIQTCPRSHMNGGHDCCHSKKSQNSYCKAMDQASVAPVAKGSVSFAKLSISTPVVLVLLPVQSIFNSFRVVSTSPPRGTLALRI